MNCPACGKELQELTIEGITVDVCQGGCGGVWFDRFELQKVDEQHEAAGEQLLDIERDPAVVVGHEARRNCPRCGDIIMMRHFFSVKHEIEVDECPQCAGMWLDQGELGSIRRQFNTEAERKQAAKAAFAHVFDTDLAQMRKESEEDLQKVKKAVNIFRFLCPSYWLPGKQEWGAY